MRYMLLTLVMAVTMAFCHPYDDNQVYHPYRSYQKQRTVVHPAPRPVQHVVYRDCDCRHQVKVKVCRKGSCVVYYNPQMTLYDNEIELIVNGNTLIYNYEDYTVNMEE